MPIPGDQYAASWAPRIQLAMHNAQNTQRLETTKWERAGASRQPSPKTLEARVRTSRMFILLRVSN
eukprot:12086573-Alexandrium_andersonii.AAC.1